MEQRDIDLRSPVGRRAFAIASEILTAAAHHDWDLKRQLVAEAVSEFQDDPVLANVVLQLLASYFAGAMVHVEDVTVADMHEDIRRHLEDGP